MVLKEIDSKDQEINALKKLFDESQSAKQKALIAKDLKTLEKGYLAEKENAWYLDFHFKDKDRFVLLHDIRIEHNGTSAQIDHLLVAPIGITILESKSTTGLLTINNDNSISVKYPKNIKTFPNPLEQNNRHQKVLSDFLNDTFDVSARFKLMGGIYIEHKVLIHPETTVTNENLPEGFERSDSFATKRNEEIDKMNPAKVLLRSVTLMPKEMVRELAKHIAKAHKPVKFDYTQKYKISKPAPGEETLDTIPEEKQCPRCNEGTLVKRKRKSKKFGSQYESDEFLGCSNYPKCRYTEEL